MIHIAVPCSVRRLIAWILNVGAGQMYSVHLYSLQLYSIQLYSLQLYSLQLYNFTSVNCTAVQLYRCTTVQLYTVMYIIQLYRQPGRKSEVLLPGKTEGGDSAPCTWEQAGGQEDSQVGRWVCRQVITVLAAIYSEKQSCKKRILWVLQNLFFFRFC